MHSRSVVIFTVLMMAYACAAVPPKCAARNRLSHAERSHLASVSEIKPRYLSLVKIETINEPGRTGVIEWVDREIAKLRQRMLPGDEVWYFREEKCPNCHWYREGYALIRGCRVVEEITLNDDM